MSATDYSVRIRISYKDSHSENIFEVKTKSSNLNNTREIFRDSARIRKQNFSV